MKDLLRDIGGTVLVTIGLLLATRHHEGFGAVAILWGVKLFKGFEI